MLQLMGIIGTFLMVFGISGGIINRNLIWVAGIGIIMLSISWMFLPKDKNFF